MTNTARLLVIDDVLGRSVAAGTNEERRNFCYHFRLRDVSPGAAASDSRQESIADAVFIRGQRPATARCGDTIENDLAGIVETVRAGFLGGKPISWNLVLLDLSFYTGSVTPESDARLKGTASGNEFEKTPPGYFGLQVLEKLHRDFPDLPMVILSSRSRAEVALRFARGGALGFIESDAADGATELSAVINRHALLPAYSSTIVGQSVPLLRALRAARRSALSDQNILIRGESGTGKELFAAYINSLRKDESRDRPLRVVNSGSLSEDMYYSELFGHVAGAFTDAKTKRIGLLEQANDGDLFLDEIANMPSRVQNGLLRVLEEGVITPLGGGEKDTKRVRIRFIAATHANLELLIAEGKFREDLYERLHRGGTLYLPPLRERLDDIPILAEQFVRRAEAELRARKRTITPEAIEKCKLYAWPRNVRQLQNCFHQAVSVAPDLEYLLPEHIVLPQSLVGANSEMPSEGLPPLLQRLAQFDFQSLTDEQLRGLLPQLEMSSAVLVAKYLAAVLWRHRKPGGKPSIQPAIQFATGDEALSTTAAYDTIKRIAKRQGAASEFSINACLAYALEKSLAGRNQIGTKPGRKMETTGDDNDV